MFQRTIRPLFLLSLLALALAGQSSAQGSDDGLWREIGETTALRSTERSVSPSKYKVFQLNRPMMRTILDSAPNEFTDGFGMSNTIVTLPMPDGSFARFRVERSLIVEPALLAKYPELAMTFRGQGIDDPAATVRFDMISSNLRSMVLSPEGTVIVDPYSTGDTSTYISYYKRDVEKPAFHCGFEEETAFDALKSPKKSNWHGFIPDAASALAAPSVTSGTQLRTYRLALAATQEYAAAVGGNTIAGTLQAQTTIMNRVNGVYERELAMKMVIIGNNNQIIYAADQTCAGVACTTQNDPYSNNSGQTMLNENINNINNVIGAANYDIGHVFSTGGGGVAGLGVVCGTSKARGVTGLSNPTGDVFAIDFVAHEMGHQYGASHTFNGNALNCDTGTRSATSAFEPGSGITIMGYAGICGNQNLGSSSIDSFHVKSLEDIVAFTTTGNGGTCAQTTATGNTPPTVTSVGGSTFNVPKQTPFTLTANATDPNGDNLTYDWQQYDLGAQTGSVPNSDADGIERPLFRAYSPTSLTARTFPRDQFILNNANVPPNTTSGFMTGEILPSIARTMNFRVIARDNRAGGGGINTANVQVVVAGTGPFKVNSPNTLGTIWFLNSNPVVTWDVGGSNAAPINAANVRILLSTDGGLTFPTVLANNTPNDGAEAVVSPAINTSNARIRIEAVGGIFFDVSDTNFTINSSPATTGAIGGRITNATGRAIPRVYVVMTNGSVTRTAITNSFGYFNFEDVTFGQTYTITPQRKGITFNPTNIVRSHNSAATDVNFIAN
jgi:hypothetical protein